MNSKAHAIVLHKALWKESSLLVQLLTDNLGVISAIVQGARKEKSPHFTHFELGNSLEVILFKSPSASIYKVIGSTHIPAKHTDPLSYPQLLSIQAALEIYTQLTLAPEETQRFFTLLQTYLDYIPTVKNNHLLVIWRFLIRLTDEMGFPIVYYDGRTYQISDKELFHRQYDQDFHENITSWLDLLPSTGKLINEFDIISDSCKMMNRFIFDWFNTHLNKKIHHRAIEMYEAMSGHPTISVK